MKQILKLVAYTLLLVVLVLASCSKELSCEDCKDSVPIANAGNDQTITLPLDSVTVDGSMSTDTDGTIVKYNWTKISGPISSKILKPESSKTIVNALVMGVYKFELTVMDNNGLAAKDTVQITVYSPNANQPPVANAGADQTIILPNNTVTLDGSKSTDPDNNIQVINWTKIAGPILFNIANANAIQTAVSGLDQGVYEFELIVTDAAGLSSKDTMQVTVEADPSTTACGSGRQRVNAQLVLLGTLPQILAVEAVASAANKIAFKDSFQRVDIYDITTSTWTTATLSERRRITTVIAAANNIFFAGGETGDGTGPTNRVDIYDALTNTWSIASLSIAAHLLLPAAVGTKVLFAGGEGGHTLNANLRPNRLDIYDVSSKTWSIAPWTGIRYASTPVASINNKLYFAGNHPDPKDIVIYDASTNSWSTSSLNFEGKRDFGAIAVNDKIYWAGGVSSITNSPTCSVEIRDINTGNSTLQYLSAPKANLITVLKNNQIIFFQPADPTKFDIYDIASNSWKIGLLQTTIKEAHIVSVNNIIYLAGGSENNVPSTKVYKLEF